MWKNITWIISNCRVLMRNTINRKHLQNWEYLWVTGIKLNTLDCFLCFYLCILFRTKTLCVFFFPRSMSLTSLVAPSGYRESWWDQMLKQLLLLMLLCSRGRRGQRRLRPPAGRLHLPVDPQPRPLQFFLELLRPDDLAGLIQSGRDAKRVSGSGKKRLRAKSWPSLLYRLEWKSCRCEVKGLQQSTAVAVARRSSGPGEHRGLQLALDFQ